MQRLLGISLLITVCLLRAADAQMVFSLDNNPQAAIGLDPVVVGGGTGAEDPFGFVGIALAPSPSLTVGPFSDATLLQSGIPSGGNTPDVHVNAPAGVNFIDALSGAAPPPMGNAIRLAFSVDRQTVGTLGTPLAQQAARNQQPGDVFGSQQVFPDPLANLYPPGVGFVGAASTLPAGGNMLLTDESALTLTATGTPGSLIGPEITAAPIAAGTHDNIDALYFKPFDADADMLADENVYFSVNPDQPGLEPLYGSAADIFVLQGEAANVFAPAMNLGLDLLGPNTDDVDALLLFDLGVAGVLEPGLDVALFSLSPGSASLEDVNPLSPGDVFVTDFQNRFMVYATVCNLGMDLDCESAGSPAADAGPAEGVAAPSSANVTALGWAALLGDMTLDGTLADDDIPDFVDGIVDPAGYFFSHSFTIPAFAGDVNLDSLQDFDDIPEFTEIMEAEGVLAVQGSIAALLPEPSGGSWLMFAITGWLLRRKSSRSTR